MLIIPALLLGGLVAVLRRPRTNEGDGLDGPTRLLRWTAGMLASPQDEWGRAMLDELVHVEGRARRWRFSIGCLAATFVLPLRGRALAGRSAMIATAVVSVGAYAWVIVHYRLGGGAWVKVAVPSCLLLGMLAGGAVLLRRPAIAAPGLLGGLFVAAAWVGASGFTFSGFLASRTSGGVIVVLLIVVPVLVGAVGAVWGGSSDAGRGTARLAAVTAACGVYLFGTLAVAFVGGRGSDPTLTVRFVVGDRLDTNVVFALMLLPVTTAMVGWAAAATVARFGSERSSATVGVSAATPAPGPRFHRVLIASGTVAAVLIALATLLKA